MPPRRTLRLPSLLLTCAYTFTGCGDDSGRPNAPEEPEESDEVDASDVVMDAGDSPAPPGSDADTPVPEAGNPSQPALPDAAREPPLDAGNRADRDAALDAGREAAPTLDGSADASQPDRGDDPEALYALATSVQAGADTFTHVVVLDSLERQPDLDLATAFPGWASIAAIGGKLFVSDRESPQLHRFAIDADRQLVADGSVSFPSGSGSSVSLFKNVFFDDTSALLRPDEGSRVLWDPSALQVLGSFDALEAASERDGLSLASSNTEGVAVRADGAFWPHFWRDENGYEFHQQSQVGIYQRDGSVTLLDAPCPALGIVTRDEADNLYFSGSGSTLPFQYLEASNNLESCVIKVNAGEQTIAPGWPRRFEELSDGRPVSRFQYLRDGKGVMLVFHDERATIDPDDTFTSFFADHWALWLVDLEAWSAVRIEQWGYTSSNVFFSRLGDRTFLHDVASDYSQTVVTELDEAGGVSPVMTVPGYALLVQLR